jgi:hypothetical protein
VFLASSRKVAFSSTQRPNTAKGFHPDLGRSKVRKACLVVWQSDQKKNNKAYETPILKPKSISAACDVISELAECRVAHCKAWRWHWNRYPVLGST